MNAIAPPAAAIDSWPKADQAAIAQYRRPRFPPLFVVLFVWALFLLLAGTVWLNAARFLDDGIAIVSAVLLALLSLALALHGVRWWHRNDRIDLYEDGVSVHRGRSSQAMRFLDVVAMHRGEIAGGTWFYHHRPGELTALPYLKLVGRGGETLAIGKATDEVFGTTIANIDRLVDHVESRLVSRLTDELVARFREGERLDFGQFLADRSGLHIKRRKFCGIGRGERSVPWWRIRSVTRVIKVNGGGNAVGTTTIRLDEVDQPIWTFPVSMDMYAVPNLAALDEMHRLTRGDERSPVAP